MKQIKNDKYFIDKLKILLSITYIINVFKYIIFTSNNATFKSELKENIKQFYPEPLGNDTIVIIYILSIILDFILVFIIFWVIRFIVKRKLKINGFKVFGFVYDVIIFGVFNILITQIMNFISTICSVEWALTLILIIAGAAICVIYKSYKNIKDS